jgi:hypothetical protein
MPMRGRTAPLVIAFLLIALDVQASPACMTKQEARTKWPTKPIYQHGSSHCWNAQQLSSRRSTAPPTNISDSATKASRSLDLSPPSPKATKTEVFFPSTIVNDVDLFDATPMTGRGALIGINDLIGINGQAPDPNNGVDGCCWPSLDSLKALIGAEK